jgi:hypothetical protein
LPPFAFGARNSFAPKTKSLFVQHRIRMQGTQVEVEVEFCFVLKLELFQFQFQDGVLQICPIFLSLRTENTMTTE